MNAQKIQELIDSGYARTSNKYGLISRIDREDWKKHMAECAYPPKYGFTEKGHEWVRNLGNHAADQYRRVYSKDTLELGRSIGLKFPTSMEGPNEFKPLIISKDNK